VTPPGRTARYFRSQSASLFGVLHEPAGNVVRDTGVLICYPTPQEYSAMLWSIRKLGQALADSGFPVLRFDYAGTGDSSGELTESSLAQWTSDIHAAADELRELAGVRRIHVVGVRLGAALALRAVTEGLRVRDLVLWDPVISGERYLALLEDFDRRIAQMRHYPVSDQREEGALIGFEMTAAFRAEIARLDLLSESLSMPHRLHVLIHESDALQSEFVTRARTLSDNVSSQLITDPVMFSGAMDPTETVLATSAPRAILEFLGTHE
jgi:pimeloyl-ACP methyl ester carboxylesterase